MHKQSFSEANLNEVLTQRKNSSKATRKKASFPLVSEVSKAIAEGNYRAVDLYSYSINGKPIYCTNSIADEAVFSKLNNNIRKLYRVKQSDRHAIVKQVISLLSEDTPKYIYKFDIKEFYKMVDVDACIEKIKDDQIISAESEIVLNEFMRQLNTCSVEGLPRGIGLSATLSELFMREFDKKVIANENVYYFSRFVDDILVFSLRELNIKKDIIEHLPNDLTLNWGKTRILRTEKCLCSTECSCSGSACRCWAKCKCKLASDSNTLSFDFLGYSFSFPSLAKNKASNKLVIDLATSKKKKIKHRLYLSFNSYIRKGNFKLLENRIKFLTGNHYISQDKHRTERMKSGVYYNYIHINSQSQYSELDSFLTKLIYFDYGKSITLVSAHKLALKKYSFKSGFKSKRLSSFNGNQINKIKGCWVNG